MVNDDNCIQYMYNNVQYVDQIFEKKFSFL